jgi:hypothetical protein
VLLTATDSDYYFGQNPQLTIVKLTNGGDNASGTGPVVAVGSTVTWTYTVTNSGNVPLSGVAVIDDQAGAVCTIGTLAPGASTTCTKTGAAVSGQYVNIGTVTGTSPLGTIVNATDSDRYFGAVASVRLQKISVNGVGAFNFTNTVPGGATSVTTVTAGTAAGATATNVAPGTYTITELAAPAGWTFTNVVCTGDTEYTVSGQTVTIDVDPGETIVCTYTNTKSGAFVGTGDTATIGYWQNKNGQALIKSMNGSETSKLFANWLAANYPAMFGVSAPAAYNLTNKTNKDVAALFITLFKLGSPKTAAQVMAGAIAAYVTTPALAGGTYSAPYGFNVSAAGTGGKLYNVGSNGAAIGLSNNTAYTVGQLLQQANARAPWDAAESGALNTIFSGINEKGDIK